jgi:hypothetical protein
MGLVKNIIAGALFSVLAATAGAQTSDSGYKPRTIDVKQSVIRTESVQTGTVQTDAVESTRRRRAVRHGNDEMPFPYTEWGQSLRISITNPQSTPCPIQFAIDGQAFYGLSFNIPPGMSWVTEDFHYDVMPRFDEEFSLRSDCAVTSMKITHYGRSPGGVYGHSIEPRRTSEALRPQPGRFNILVAPAPDVEGMDLSIAIKTTSKNDTIISPSIAQSYEGALFSYAVGKQPILALQGKYGFGEGIARDDETGFITRVPEAPVFGLRASVSAAVYTPQWRISEVPVLGEAIIRDLERNRDSYAALVENECTDWAVILGVANKVPGFSANTPEPMGYTTVPTFYTGEGSMYIGVATNTHVENGMHKYGWAFEHPARRNPIPLIQPEGTYSALEIVCAQDEKCFIPFANTQQRDIQGLIGVERNIIGTEKDLVDYGEMGIATMIGEYKGARTEFDFYAKEPTIFRVDVFNDLGETFGSAMYTMGAQEYRRIRLTDIAQCAPHPEMTYGHARIVVQNEGGRILGGFSRFDNGGGDKIVGKFNPVKINGQLYEGTYPDIVCSR